MNYMSSEFALEEGKMGGWERQWCLLLSSPM